MTLEASPEPGRLSLLIVRALGAWLFGFVGTVISVALSTAVWGSLWLFAFMTALALVVWMFTAVGLVTAEATELTRTRRGRWLWSLAVVPLGWLLTIAPFMLFSGRLAPLAIAAFPLASVVIVGPRTSVLASVPSVGLLLYVFSMWLS